MTAEIGRAHLNCDATILAILEGRDVWFEEVYEIAVLDVEAQER